MVNAPKPRRRRTPSTPTNVQPVKVAGGWKYRARVKVKGTMVYGAVRETKDDAVEDVVLLLGNTVMIDGRTIDHCLEVLDSDPNLDSVMTVWEAADDHPLRALEIHKGLLRPYGDPERQVSTERQSYPKAYYYDQGVWAFRKGCVERREGPNPWWWMGKNCQPVIRSWVTGRDVHTQFDLDIAEWWLTRA